MKRYIIAAFTLLTTAIYAQDINRVNAQGQREGAWIGYFPQTNHLRYEGSFKNGKEIGVFKFYADEPVEKLVATKEFKQDGSVFTIFYNGKKKMSEGNYINKKKEGIWITYHFDGVSIMAEEPYKNDQLHGIKKVYYPSGNLSEEIEYKNGIEDGISVQYAENGVKIKETQYKKGVLDGPIIIRNAEGEIIDQDEYVDGKLMQSKKS